MLLIKMYRWSREFTICDLREIHSKCPGERPLPNLRSTQNSRPDDIRNPYAQTKGAPITRGGLPSGRRQPEPTPKATLRVTMSMTIVRAMHVHHNIKYNYTCSIMLPLYKH